MTLGGRLNRYVKAWKELPSLRSFRIEDHSIDELIDLVFNWDDGFLAPIQIREEILEACQEVQARRPRFIVEIGTSGGATLFLWSRLADPKAVIVTIDLPGGQFGAGSSLLRVPIFRRLGLPEQTIHLIRGDSHRPETLELTRRYLGGQPADFLFIDADHTDSGVRSDYQMYSPLVREGGLIAFHDIAITSPEYGVRKLWKELAQPSSSREILGQPTAYGIGLLYR